MRCASHALRTSTVMLAIVGTALLLLFARSVAWLQIQSSAAHWRGSWAYGSRTAFQTMPWMWPMKRKKVVCLRRWTLAVGQVSRRDTNTAEIALCQPHLRAQSMIFTCLVLDQNLFVGL